MQAESSSLQLKQYDEYMYDNIILFAPTIKEFNTITTADIIAFSEDGGNILFAANSMISDSMRQLAALCGVDFDKKGSKVIDHFNYIGSSSNNVGDSNNEDEDDSDGILDHTLIVSKNIINNSAILGSELTTASASAIVYQGIGHSIDGENVLAYKVMYGNPTTYSSVPSSELDSKSTDSKGANTLLVTAIQGRTNSRLIFTGSTAMFTNEFYHKNAVSNEQFCYELSKWVFAERSVLRFRDITHSKTDLTPPDVILHEKERPDLPITLYPDPELTRNSLVYRIKDTIIFSMIVEESVNGEWKPYKCNDMQMEFVMLDPYVRKTMSSEANGLHHVTFMAPDSYGIFKFRVLYRRPGYSVLHSETQVSIRPFKHNEYERFIFSAYPYYTSAFSAMIAFFVFSVFFLFSSNDKAIAIDPVAKSK